MLRSRAMYRWALLFVIACSDPQVDPTRVELARFPAVESRALDLMFVIADSGSVVEWQRSLAAEAPALFAALADGGALPDLHIGVISPDMGTAGSNAIAESSFDTRCAGSGKDGALLSRLVDVDDGSGGRIRNYDGTLATAFSAATRIGTAGCGFSQPLHAIRRARTVNAEFWRSEASTAIILLSDEDDCSVTNPQFFEQDADLGSFLCTRHGLVCDQPLDEVGPKTNCRADTRSRFLEDPRLTHAFLETERPPERLTFSAIGAPPTPIVVDQLQDFWLRRTCTRNFPTGASVADPLLRISDLTRGFASRGNLHSICDESYVAALQSIATAIERSLGVACLDATHDLDLTSCVAHDVRDDGERTELARCPAAGDCFDIIPDTTRCGGNQRVVVDRKTTPASTTHVAVSCDVPEAR